MRCQTKLGNIPQHKPVAVADVLDGHTGGGRRPPLVRGKISRYMRFHNFNHNPRGPFVMTMPSRLPPIQISNGRSLVLHISDTHAASVIFAVESYL